MSFGTGTSVSLFLIFLLVFCLLPSYKKNINNTATAQSAASLTLPSENAGCESPSRILEAAVLNASKPRMGKYSWVRVSSSASIFSTFLTTGSTHGLQSSVRYAGQGMGMVTYRL